MSQDTTPSIIVYQGTGSKSVFDIPFDKGYYGEIKVLFVRRGLADYTYYPSEDLYEVSGRLYAWSFGSDFVYTHTANPAVGAKTYDYRDIEQSATVSAIAGQTITVDGVTYYRSVQSDMADNMRLTWAGDMLQVGDFIAIIRDTERGQPYEYPNNQKHIERALDNLERQIQEVKDAADNALKVDPAHTIDPSKMGPIDWMNTILRSVDLSVRALRFADGWLDYSFDDPNIASIEKTWHHLLNTQNIKSIRERSRVESGKIIYWTEYLAEDGAWKILCDTGTWNTKIDKAISIAEEARDTSNEAKDIVNSAVSTANNAVSVANNAKEIAENIDAKAQEALDNSGIALDNANEALEKVEQEKSDRQGADATLQDNIGQEALSRSNADIALQDQITANKSIMDSHIADTSNPHGVTKAQVGLGNVDNTSDLDKPISTATQTALNGKQATISDLATIRSGASAGATAVQPGDLATVATSGSYNDLSNKPTIPAAQVNSDWNATSGVAQILNKPTLGTMAAESASDYTKTSGLATVATSGSYTDLSNKPTVGNGTITITQGGVNKGTFTTNQSGDTTVALDAGGGGIGNIDNLTITANANQEIQTVATINANTATGATNPIYDWVGTLEEYNNATPVYCWSAGSSLKVYTTTETPTTSDIGYFGIPSIPVTIQAVGINTISTGGLTYTRDSTQDTYWDVSFEHPDWLCFIIDDESGSIRQGNNIIASKSVWGGIGGTLSDQTDLQNALDSKANVNLSNTPANIDYVIDFQEPTAANNYTWYRKYRSGWVEQGGQITIANQGVNSQLLTNATLPIIMADTNYSVSTCFLTDGGNSTGLRNHRNVRYTTYLQIGTFSTTNTLNSWLMGWQVSGMAA